MYIPMAGFSTRITENISYKTRHLPVDEADYEYLLEHIADDDHTFLELRDGNTIEVVKLVNICDKLLMERGAEKTRPMPFRCGTGLSFVMTEQGIKDEVCQMNDCP